MVVSEFDYHIFEDLTEIHLTIITHCVSCSMNWGTGKWLFSRCIFQCKQGPSKTRVFQFELQ